LRISFFSFGRILNAITLVLAAGGAPRFPMEVILGCSQEVAAWYTSGKVVGPLL